MAPTTRARLAPAANLSSSFVSTKPQPAAQDSPLKRRRTAPPSIPTKRAKPSPSSPSSPADPPAPLRAFPTFNTDPSRAEIIPVSALHFDFATAKRHLVGADERFEKVFEKLRCRPFQDLEDVDPFRSLVTSIIGQQVSWLAARAINHKFRRLFDPSLPEKAGDSSEGWGGSLTYFPTPSDVVQLDIAQLKSAGLSTRKAEYVRSLAEHFLSGQLSPTLLSEGSIEDVSKALIDVRGIGQWTVDMFLIFTLRRADVLPVGDLGVQKGLIKWILSAYENKPYPADESKVDLPLHAGPPASIKQEAPRTPPADASSVLPGPPATPSDTEALLLQGGVVFPPTPATPASAKDSTGTPAESPAPKTPKTKKAETGEMKAKKRLEATLHLCPPGYQPEEAYPFGEMDGMSIEVLKGRLGGKKIKGQYLTPGEMDALTKRWAPYRSLGVYYMWAVAEESS